MQRMCHLLDAALAERLELTVHRVNPLPYGLYLLPCRIGHPFQLLTEETTAGIYTSLCSRKKSHEIPNNTVLLLNQFPD